MEGATETEKEGGKIAWTEERSNDIVKFKCVWNFVQRCVLFESINQIKKVIKFVKDHLTLGTFSFRSKRPALIWVFVFNKFQRSQLSLCQFQVVPE